MHSPVRIHGTSQPMRWAIVPAHPTCAFVNRLDASEQRPTLAEVGAVLRSFLLQCTSKPSRQEAGEALESNTPLPLTPIGVVPNRDIRTSDDGGPENQPFSDLAFTSAECPDFELTRLRHAPAQNPAYLGESSQFRVCHPLASELVAKHCAVTRDQSWRVLRQTDFLEAELSPTTEAAEAFHRPKIPISPTRIR